MSATPQIAASDASPNSFLDEIGCENVLPKYVLNWLVYSGVDNATIFGDLDETAIEEMEKLYRKKLPKILAKVGAAKMEEYCPRFVEPEEFELQYRHRRILIKMVETFKTRTGPSASAVASTTSAKPKQQKTAGTVGCVVAATPAATVDEVDEHK